MELLDTEVTEEELRENLLFVNMVFSVFSPGTAPRAVRASVIVLHLPFKGKQ